MFVLLVASARDDAGADVEGAKSQRKILTTQMFGLICFRLRDKLLQGSCVQSCSISFTVVVGAAAPQSSAISPNSGVRQRQPSSS